ncbi:PilZ domain-containing protein [Acidocella sp.]|jgi:hypothetical protein|uniref:PilZ domain-containing protein n=1 Tax=Acidocella sp. TaxID=50710 RepID=UPI002F42A3CA
MNALTAIASLQTTEFRREPRFRTLKSGKLLYGGFGQTVVDCVVLDLSKNGARAETTVTAPVPVPEFLTLRMNDNVSRPARRCWTRGNQIGIEFLPSPDKTDG